MYHLGAVKSNLKTLREVYVVQVLNAQQHRLPSLLICHTEACLKAGRTRQQQRWMTLFEMCTPYWTLQNIFRHFSNRCELCLKDKTLETLENTQMEALGCTAEISRISYSNRRKPPSRIRRDVDTAKLAYPHFIL
jgi:hypothetical protein